MSVFERFVTVSKFSIYALTSALLISGAAVAVATLRASGKVLRTLGDRP